MIATPASVLAEEPPDTASLASLKLVALPNRVETEVAVGLASSRSVPSVALLLATGASFTAVTLWLSTTLAELKAVVPPGLLTFTEAPLVTLVEESISLTVSVGAAPFQFDAGTNFS